MVADDQLGQGILVSIFILRNQLVVGNLVHVITSLHSLRNGKQLVVFLLIKRSKSVIYKNCVLFGVKI